MTMTQKILIIVGCVLLLLLIWWLLGTRGAFSRLRKKARAAYSELCSKTYELYAFSDRIADENPESKEIKEITEAKYEAQSMTSAESKAKSDSILRNRLSRYLSEIKSDSAEEFDDIQSDIFRARKKYNNIVREYNYKRKAFPDKIIGAIFRFSIIEYYTADEVQNMN